MERPMIDQQDRAVQEWIASAVDSAPVTLALPTNGDAPPGITLYLMDIASEPIHRGARDAPLRVTLRYLVTSGIGAFVETHRMLGDALFAALEHAEYEVEREPVPLAFWHAIGAAPRPAFVLRVPCHRERVPEPMKRVRAAPTIQSVPVLPLVGVVLGPGDVPIVDALVEVQALGLAQRTDRDGRFAFRTIPAAPLTNMLRITAKGYVLSQPVTRAPTETDGLVIHFEPLEDA
jgi:hypothetical protein